MRRFGVIAVAVLVVGLVSSGAFGMRYELYPEPLTGISGDAIRELFVRAIEKNDVEAEYKLGVLFYTLFEAANFENAPEHVARFYSTTFNLTQARYWFELAANQDYAPAQYMLGSYWRWTQDGSEQSLMWMAKAIENGYARAQASEAHLLYISATAKKSMEILNQAIELATKSAEQGDALGMYVLSEIYENGTKYSPIDQAKADEWKKKALEAAKNDPTIKFFDTEKPASKPQKPISSKDWYSGEYNGRSYQARYRITKWTHSGDKYTIEIEDKQGNKRTVSSNIGEVTRLPMPIQFTLPDWIEEIHVDNSLNFEILDDGTLEELELVDESNARFRRAFEGNVILLVNGKGMTLWSK